MEYYTVRVQVQVPAYAEYMLEAKSADAAAKLAQKYVEHNDFWSSDLWLSDAWACDWEEAHSPRIAPW